MPDIKINIVVRPCVVLYGNNKVKALFHNFTLEDGNAVVEFENGECTTVAPWNIRFVDSQYKFKEYSFE